MNTIVVNQAQSNKSENMVWVVYIEGQDDSRQFCKSARAAMKYMFLLKSRTGLYISKEGLQMLSAEIARLKNPEAVAKIQEHAEAIAEAYDVNRILTQPTEVKEAVVEEVAPKPKKRGRKPKVAKAA